MRVDIQWISAGPGVPKHGPQDTNSVANTAYVMPSSQFEEAGILQGWEVHTGVAGEVELMVYIMLNLYCTDNILYSTTTVVASSNIVKRGTSMSTFQTSLKSADHIY